MINVEQLRYERLGTRDLAGAVNFAQQILALELVGRSEEIAYLRSDYRDHTLVAGDTAYQSSGGERRRRDAIVSLSPGAAGPHRVRAGPSPELIGAVPAWAKSLAKAAQTHRPR